MTDNLPTVAARAAVVLRDCAVAVMRTDCDYARLSGRLFHQADALDAAAKGTCVWTCEFRGPMGEWWKPGCKEGQWHRDKQAICEWCGKPVEVKEASHA